MTTNEEKTAAELDDPRILLCDSKLDNVQEILPALIACAEDGCDLLIICEALSDDARSTILRTDMDGDIKIVCIEAPLYGDGRRWRMEDLAVQLGATYFQKALNMDLRSAKREDFGTAAHARVTKQQTVISGPGGDKAAVEARVRELRYLAANEDYEFNRKAPSGAPCAALIRRCDHSCGRTDADGALGAKAAAGGCRPCRAGGAA